MRLEVLVNNDDPEIYPLNKSEIFIGSGESADIIISHTGVSRRHVKISVINDQYFVTDQGSTNGTFINEERLIPGRRLEFTSFFPVRLGDSVLLSLLSDEESESELLRDFIKKGPDKEDSSSVENDTESTRVISLKDLKKAKTQDLVKKRKTVITKRQTQKKQPKKSSNKMLLPTLLCLFILGVGYYLNEENKEELAKQSIEEAQKLAVRPVPPKPQSEVISVPEEIPKEKLETYFYGLKCTLSEEIDFCNSSKLFSEKLNGVIRVGNSYIVMIEENEWLEKGLNGLPGEKTIELLRSKENEPSQGNVSETKLDHVYKIAFLEFLKETKIDINKYGDHAFYFVFYKYDSEKPNVQKVVTLNSGYHSRIMSIYNERAIRAIKRYGFNTILEMDNFIKMY